MLLDDSAEAVSSFRYNAYGEMLEFNGVVTDGCDGHKASISEYNNKNAEYLDKGRFELW